MTLQIPPGGFLLGLGCDIIEISRVRESIERQGERFLERVYTAEERAYCGEFKMPWAAYAARFAAKEAVSKCFGTGIGAELGWKSVSIRHGERGEPLVVLDEQGQALLAKVGATQVMISLSHSDTMAMAIAGLVR